MENVAQQPQQPPINTSNDAPLSASVEVAIKGYFSQLGEQTPANVYDLVLAEVEEPLLKAMLEYTRGNQSKAAILLGISRGTLRKKLKIYGLL